VEWAETQNNLGIAYTNLPTGDRGEDLRQAVACYDAALEVLTRDAFPADWAQTRYNTGLACEAIGDPRTAEGCFEDSLQVWTEAAFPHDHADAAWARVRVRAALASPPLTNTASPTKLSPV